MKKREVVLLSVVIVSFLLVSVLYYYHSVRRRKISGIVERFRPTRRSNVVSFSLYGNSNRYLHGAIENAQLVKKFYPGWTCRFYHDNSVPKETLEELLDLGAELVNVEDAGMGKELGGMFWRFLVAIDPHVDKYMVRDVDSRLGEREAAAVREWLNSDFPLHSMRDHRNHNFPLNGGMWGGSKGAIPTFYTRLEEWRGKHGYLADMNFLDTLWPDIKERVLSHDAYFCGKYPNCRPFPTERVNSDDHVGFAYG